MFFRIDRFITAENCRQKAAALRERAATANGQAGSYLALAESWEGLATQYEHLEKARARLAFSWITEASTRQ